MSPIMHATCENSSQPRSTFAGHFRHLTDDSRTVHSRYRPRGFPVRGRCRCYLLQAVHRRHAGLPLWSVVATHPFTQAPHPLPGVVGRMRSAGLTYLSFLPMVVGLLAIAISSAADGPGAIGTPCSGSINSAANRTTGSAYHSSSSTVDCLSRTNPAEKPLVQHAHGRVRQVGRDFDKADDHVQRQRDHGAVVLVRELLAPGLARPRGSAARTGPGRPYRSVL